MTATFVGIVISKRGVRRGLPARASSVLDVGPVVSGSQPAELPELGHLNRKQIAALVGVEPLRVTV